MTEKYVFAQEITKILPFKKGDNITFRCRGKDHGGLTGGVDFSGILCNVYVMNVGDGFAEHKPRTLLQASYTGYKVCMVLRANFNYSLTEMLGDYTLIFPLGLLDAPEFCIRYDDGSYALSIGSDEYENMLHDEYTNKEYWTILITEKSTIEIEYEWQRF